MPFHYLLKHSTCSPLRTYNMRNHHPYTPHTPLKYRILYLKHTKMHCKVYHSMPLHTYASNFDTSSSLQLISNIPFTPLFVLIMPVITLHIGHKHHSRIISYN